MFSDDACALSVSFDRPCKWWNSWLMNINFNRIAAACFINSTLPSPFNYCYLSDYFGDIFTVIMLWSKHVNFICNQEVKKASSILESYFG